MYPTDLRYTKDHEWVRPSGKYWRVGITSFATKQLGDIVMVELPEVGQRHEHAEALGTIESVKAVSEVYAPVSGTIRAVNEQLRDEPELVNEDPHGEGWLYEVEPSNASEKDGLLSAAEYESFLKEASE